jgi:oligopeptidase B
MTDTTAPVAKRVPHTWQRPTGPTSDPYAWLADRDHPDTIALLTAENDHADAWFAPHADLVEDIFGEIRHRVQEDDSSVPVRSKSWWYATRTVQGASYPIHGRGPTADTAHQVVLLDENLEAAGHEYFSVGAFDVSPDEGLLAWSSDVDGGEHFTMRIRDIGSGVDLSDELQDTTWGGTAWSADSRYLFYVTPDDQERPSCVWRHQVGTPQSDDVKVYEDTDERFFVSIGLSRSDQWIVIESESKLSSEVRLVPAASPLDIPRAVRPREPDVEYHLDHWGDRFVVHTNLEAQDFRVMTAPLDDPAAWTEFVPHVPGRRITRVEPFASHLVVHEWAEAQTRLRIVQPDGSSEIVDLGSEPHDVDLDSNPEWSATTLRFTYESLTTPTSVFERDLTTGERVLLKQTPTPNVDLTRYTSTREWATSADGTRVPVDVVRLADAEPDGTAPCLVYGYGSYEISIPPWFSVARLSLIDRGWTWALVHPRGGGELGRGWYLEGKLLSKCNTFDDTNACADHLAASGWAAPDRLAIRGGSAGGLLVGACINLRPDRWSAAVAEVPFVDVVTTMSDPSLPLTVTEWEEWGDPRVEPHASYMLSYSPYDNTTARDYPALYVTAGLNDPRVAYHEPAKWVSRIREVRTNDAPLLLKTELGAGHGGPSGRYERWRDEARVLAFLIGTIGDAS